MEALSKDIDIIILRRPYGYWGNYARTGAEHLEGRCGACVKDLSYTAPLDPRLVYRQEHTSNVIAQRMKEGEKPSDISGPCYIPPVICQTDSGKGPIALGLWSYPRRGRLGSYTNLCFISARIILHHASENLGVETASNIAYEALQAFEVRLTPTSLRTLWNVKFFDFLHSQYTWPMVAARLHDPEAARFVRREYTPPPYSPAPTDRFLAPNLVPLCGKCYGDVQEAYVRDLFLAARQFSQTHVNKAAARRGMLRSLIAVIVSVARAPQVCLYMTLSVVPPVWLHEMPYKGAFLPTRRITLGPVSFLESVAKVFVDDPDRVLADHMDAWTAKMVTAFINWYVHVYPWIVEG